MVEIIEQFFAKLAVLPILSKSVINFPIQPINPHQIYLARILHYVIPLLHMLPLKTVDNLSHTCMTSRKCKQ